jgi:hypothetical protein
MSNNIWSGESLVGRILASDLAPLPAYARRSRTPSNPRDNAARKILRQMGCDVTSVSWVRSQHGEFAKVTPFAIGSEDMLLDFLTRPDSPIVTHGEELDQFGHTTYLIGWASESATANPTRTNV